MSKPDSRKRKAKMGPNPAVPPLPTGVVLHPGALTSSMQKQLLSELEKILDRAPWFQPRMPRTGQPFSVRMTNCGPLGWVSDQQGGYRYQAEHPDTGEPWPPIPEMLMKLWAAHAGMYGFSSPPEACLVNAYGPAARMGSHRDSDEAELGAPVVSVSLGADAVFHVGGLKRSDPKVRMRLSSGDVLVFGGPARLVYHGVDRIVPGPAGLLPAGERINLTLRRVTPFRAPAGPVAPEGRPRR